MYTVNCLQAILFCLPGWGILSSLSTESTPWFSRLLNGLPQLRKKAEKHRHVQRAHASPFWSLSHLITEAAPVLSAQTEDMTHFPQTNRQRDVFEASVQCLEMANQKKESSMWRYLLQSDGGRQWGVVELGALWLWVKALWWVLVATEPGVRSVRGPAGSGSCTEHVFVVGLETGVPWTGGDGHGEPRGDTLERGKPEKESNTDSNVSIFA